MACEQLHGALRGKPVGGPSESPQDPMLSEVGRTSATSCATGPTVAMFGKSPDCQLGSGAGLCAAVLPFAGRRHWDVGARLLPPSPTPVAVPSRRECQAEPQTVTRRDMQYVDGRLWAVLVALACPVCPACPACSRPFHDPSTQSEALCRGLHLLFHFCIFYLCLFLPDAYPDLYPDPRLCPMHCIVTATKSDTNSRSCRRWFPRCNPPAQGGACSCCSSAASPGLANTFEA